MTINTHVCVWMIDVLSLERYHSNIEIQTSSCSFGHLYFCPTFLGEQEGGGEADVGHKSKQSSVFPSLLLLFGSKVWSSDGSVATLCFSIYRDSEVFPSSALIYYSYKLDLQSADKWNDSTRIKIQPIFAHSHCVHPLQDTIKWRK